MQFSTAAAAVGLLWLSLGIMGYYPSAGSFFSEPAERP